jgi:vancomycin permeability regulator SanA
MFRQVARVVTRLLKIAFLLGLAALIIPRLVTALHAWAHIIDAGSVAPGRVAVVFGAGLWRNGSPTPVLRDRVATAARLYHQGKITKILMSGDKRNDNYNEPEAMRTYALSLGVPAESIVMDYAGHDTYATCYRAQAIFGLREVVLVTQKFHLPRALYICRNLGMDAQGVPADNRRYRLFSLVYWNFRELIATANALLEVHFTHPLPVLGKPQPIYSQEIQ